MQKTNPLKLLIPLIINNLVRIPKKMFNSKILLFVFSLILFFTQAATAAPVRILPLGDSITDGNGFNNPDSSYRDELYSLLTSGSYDFEFVGNESSTFGSITLKHEGHPGLRADEIDSGINTWYDSIGGVIDIVLLHAGTNDILQSQGTDANTQSDIEAIILKLQTKNPNIIILVANIIPVNNPDEAISLNALLDTTWASTYSTTTSSVLIVDHNTGFVIPTDYSPIDLPDYIHPSQSGEDKMANKWLDALTQLPIIQASALPVNTDLTLWLDASDVDADNIPDQPVANTPVTTWKDKSGEANDVTQIAGTTAPTQFTPANGQNNKPVVDFASSGLETPDNDQITADSSYTKFVVFKYDSTTTANNLIASSPYETTLWSGSSSGGDQIEAAHSSGSIVSTGPIGTGDYHIVSFRYDPAGLGNRLHLDDTAPMTNIITATHTAAKTNIGSIGALFNLDGKIAEALIYDRELTDAEIDSIETYLADKWGLLTSDVDAGESTVSASPTSVDADGTSTSTITVTAKDANSTPLPGLTVTLDQGAGVSSIGAVTDNGDGTYDFDVTSTTAETVTYTATADGVAITQTANVTFNTVFGPVDPGNSSVTASPTSIVADGFATSTVTITARDASNNLLSGLTVSLDQGAGASTIGAVTDNGDGTYDFDVTSSTAEAVTYTATADSVQITQTAVVTFTAGSVNAGSSTVTAAPTSVVADGTTASTVTVTAKDANDNPLAGLTVSLDQGAGASTIGAVTDNGDGTYDFDVTSSTAEAVTYTATADSVQITQAVLVTFTPDPSLNIIPILQLLLFEEE